MAGQLSDCLVVPCCCGTVLRRWCALRPHTPSEGDCIALTVEDCAVLTSLGHGPVHVMDPTFVDGSAAGKVRGDLTRILRHA